MTAHEAFLALSHKSNLARPYVERPMDPEKLLFWSPVHNAEADLSTTLKRRFARTLELSQTSLPQPSQSGFYVFTAAAVGPGPWLSGSDEGIVPGGNIEYGLSNAAHGEESAVFGILNRYGLVPIQVVGFYYNPEPVNEKTFADPCGGCRDRLMPYCNPNMYFVQAGPPGKHADMVSVTQFRDYLFDTPRLVNPSSLNPTGHAQAIHGLKVGVSGYLPETLKPYQYGAAIVAEDGTVWQGSHWVNAGYDAFPSFSAALQTWRNASPQANVSKIVIAGAGSNIPLPLYADRQDALEFAEALSFYRHGNINSPLPVELIQVNRAGEIISAALSNTSELLPHPFSAGEFGMTSAMQEYMAVLSLTRFR